MPDQQYVQATLPGLDHWRVPPSDQNLQMVESSSVIRTDKVRELHSSASEIDEPVPGPRCLNCPLTPSPCVIVIVVGNGLSIETCLGQASPPPSC